MFAAAGGLFARLLFIAHRGVRFRSGAPSGLRRGFLRYSTRDLRPRLLEWRPSGAPNHRPNLFNVICIRFSRDNRDERH